jgi:predicted TIM-barrel fold metal-dependent hydrolase
MSESTHNPVVVAEQSAPRHAPPSGACDCHAHVFGPFDRFPPAPERSYDPPLATAEMYRDVLDRCDLARGVLVQPSAYGRDNGALLHALDTFGDRLRGVAVKDVDVSDAELGDMHARGVRALRFTEVTRLGHRFGGSVGFAALETLAPRLRALGWHAKLYARIDRIAAALPALTRLGVPLVIDHMGQFGPGERGADDPDVQSVIRHLADGRIWVKLSAFRNSGRLPDCDDVRAFHDAFLRANPDQVIWGSDWPYVNMGDRAPDLGKLLDVLTTWTPGEALRRKILVDNPVRLYGFEPD